MNILGYNIDKYNVDGRMKIIILTFILLLVVCLVLFILFSYVIFKLLKMEMEDSNVFFYQFNKKSQCILDKYGKYKITRAYLVKNPLGKLTTLLLNSLTFFQYQKLINESQNSAISHSLIIFEIEMPNNVKKLLMLEKNNCINLCENFFINSKLDIKTINMKNNDYTLNYILETTRERIGNKKFFNWHIFKNNCHKFTKEILITMKKYNKTNKEYIFCNETSKLITFTDFTFHIGNCLILICNICEKYINDNNIFY